MACFQSVCVFFPYSLPSDWCYIVTNWLENQPEWDFTQSIQRGSWITTNWPINTERIYLCGLQEVLSCQITKSVMWFEWRNNSWASDVMLRDPCDLNEGVTSEPLIFNEKQLVPIMDAEYYYSKVTYSIDRCPCIFLQDYIIIMALQGLSLL